MPWARSPERAEKRESAERIYLPALPYG